MSVTFCHLPLGVISNHPNTYSKDSKKRCLVNWSKNRATLVYNHESIETPRRGLLLEVGGNFTLLIVCMSSLSDEQLQSFKLRPLFVRFRPHVGFQVLSTGINFTGN